MSVSVSGNDSDDDDDDESGVELRDRSGVELEERETMDAGRSFQCSLITPDWCEVAGDEDAARENEVGVVYILMVLGGS